MLLLILQEIHLRSLLYMVQEEERLCLYRILHLEINREWSSMLSSGLMSQRLYPVTADSESRVVMLRSVWVGLLYRITITLLKLIQMLHPSFLMMTGVILLKV